MSCTVSHSPEETRGIARAIGQQCAPGDVITLDGQLGAGKTHFVQGLAWGLDVPLDVIVNSPSYVLLNIYEGGRLPIYHFDWYRLERPQDLEGLDVWEYLEGDGVTVIEWAAKFPNVIPAAVTAVQIDVLDETTRRFHVDHA